MTPSYGTPYASPARSSRVWRPFRGLSTLSRLADVEGEPHFVLLEASGTRVTIDYGEHFEVLGVADPSQRTRKGKVGGDVVFLFPDGYVSGGAVTHFDPVLDEDGKLVFSTGISAGARTWAASFDGTRWVSVASIAPTRTRPTMALAVFADIRFSPPRTTSRTLWSEKLEPDGCGAIAGDGRVVVAQESGRFAVYGPEARAGTIRGVVQVDVPLSARPIDLAVLEDGYAVLVDSGRGRNELRLLGSDGREVWRVPSPVATSAPPIDGGGGRLYLGGGGIAAIERGGVAWARTSPLPHMATAFGDGALAVTAGRELLVLGRDGATLFALAVEEGESFRTPPAIGADGSVWAATERALYVAR
jgi:hypothetical protein